MNVLGDVFMPAGVLVISTLFTFALYRVTRRDQRIERETERLIQHATTFANATRDIWPEHFLKIDPKAGIEVAGQLEQAIAVFVEFADTSSRQSLRMYLNHLRQALRTFAYRSRQSYLVSAALPGSTFYDPVKSHIHASMTDPYTAHERARARELLQAIRSIVSDWPYPERRRSCADRIVRAREESIGWSVPTDMKLQVDYEMLAMKPSKSRLRRQVREFPLRIRGLADDYRFGRLGRKSRDWVRFTPDRLRAHRELHDYVRNEKARRRDVIALRRIYEDAAVHYRRIGQEPPWITGDRYHQFPSNVAIDRSNRIGEKF